MMMQMLFILILILLKIVYGPTLRTRAQTLRKSQFPLSPPRESYGSSYFRIGAPAAVRQQPAEVATSALLSADTYAEVATSAKGPVIPSARNSRK